jgi:MFS transporter, SP family, xylose:H+ symportor
VKLNRYLLGCALVAALGSLLFGFDTAVMSGTKKGIVETFHLDWYWITTTPPEALKSQVLVSAGGFSVGFGEETTIAASTTAYRLGEFLSGFTVASAILGTIVGSLCAGRPADAFGRKPMLLCLAVLYFVSAIGSGLAWNWWALLLMRFIGGLAIGGASVAAPMYIAEISPPEIRGRLVAASQLNVVIGVLSAYLSNYVVAALTHSEVAAWRWMLGIMVVPAAMFFVFALPIPESPRWLVKRHRRDEALRVLGKLGNEDAQALIGRIAESLHEETVAADEPFFRRKYMAPILLAFMVATFNQFTGINALTYYTASIFEMAGARRDNALLQSVIIGVTQLIFTVIAMSVIDRFGRKKLLIVGAIGLAACLATVAGAFYIDEQIAAGAMSKSYQAAVGPMVLGSLIGYMAFFAFSQGSVIWVFLSEIFPNRVRARGQAFGTFIHWFWCAVVAWTFPVIADFSKSGPFVLFSAMMVLQLVLVWKYLPETKGVSLEQIQRELGIE